MELHELIWKRLSEDSEISGRLTQYAGQPAVFTPEAPSDKAQGWGGRMNYPRIVFAVDLSANEERKCQGSMVLSIDTKNNGEYDCGAMIAAIRRCLCNVVLTPEGDSPYCLAWNRSDGYVIDGSDICGQELQFDLIEYPSQETTDPDPIDGLNSWLKALYPEALIMWHDRMNQEEDFQQGRPVLYCRLEADNEDVDHSTFAVAWMTASIVVHVFSSGSGSRGKYVRAIERALALEGEYELPDRSPFLVSSIAASPSADYLRTGQLRITGRYGILRQTEKQKRIRNTKTDYKTGG